MEVTMKFLRLLPFLVVALAACDTGPVTEVSAGPSRLRLQYFLADTPTVGTTYNVWATVEDARGRGVAGIRVLLDTDSLSGYVPASVMTNSDGRALIQWALDIQAGPQTLHARVEDVDTVEIRVPTKAGAIARFAIQSHTILLTSYEQSARIHVSGFDEFGNARDGTGLNWISRDTRIASVDADAIVTPVSFGKTWVVGRLANGAADSAFIDVATPLR
jgi:hypothetical protein